MCGYVACLHFPVEGAVGEEVQQFTAGDIVLGIHQVEVPVNGIHDDAIGHTDLLDLRGSGEAVGDNLVGTYIDDAVSDGILHRHLAPLTAVEIERVTHDAQVADGLVQMSANLHLAISILCQPPETARFIGIVASGRHPELSVFVSLHMMQVRGHLYLVCLLHRLEIYHTHCTLIALSRHPLIASTIRNEKMIAEDSHLFGLVTDSTGVCLLQ